MDRAVVLEQEMEDLTVEVVEVQRVPSNILAITPTRSLLFVTSMLFTLITLFN